MNSQTLDENFSAGTGMTECWLGTRLQPSTEYPCYAPGILHLQAS